MKRNLLITILLPILLALFSSCQSQVPPGSGLDPGSTLDPGSAVENPYPTIGSIPPPAGYTRVLSDNASQTSAQTTASQVETHAAPQPLATSFGDWLRTVRLKKDKTVYLYDGSRKRNQSAQFAVLDISVGKEDLQQCADAIMRLRAEYLYREGDFSKISFRTGEGIWLNFGQWAHGRRYFLEGGRLSSYETGHSCHDRNCFDAYLRTVFSYCGTLSLEKQLASVTHPRNIHRGDVWVHGGSPGHAMLVVDVAVDNRGRKVYLLAQSYMPAQDIHLVLNPQNKALSPWFAVDEAPVYTPEWTFYPSELRTWTNFLQGPASENLSR